MNTKVPRSFAISCSLAICLLVTLGIAFAQSSSASWGDLQNDYLVTSTPTNSGAYMPSGQIGSAEDITTTITLAYWRNMRPTESYLHSVSMLPSSYEVDCISPDQKSKGWAVGGNGVILYYCNGIWDHAITVESMMTDLFSVQAISPTLGVASGEDGTILLYLYDRIALDWVWTKSPIPIGDKSLYGISLVPDGAEDFSGWAVGVSDNMGRGTLVRGMIMPGELVNGFRTYTYWWENVTNTYFDPSFPEVDSYYDVHTLSPTNAWAVGGKEGVRGVIIHWNGTNWSVAQEFPGQALYGLHMNSADDGWAVGNGGVIYHYNGTTWSAVASPTTKLLTAVDFAPNGEGWIVGYDGALLKYKGGGWTVFNDLRTDYLDFRAIDFSSGHGWSVGLQFRTQMGGHILEYDQGLWLAVTPPTDNRLNEVYVVNDNNAWAVGAADDRGGTIIHWDGKHWQRWYQEELPIPAQDLYTVYMISADDGWAAGEVSQSGAPALILHWDGHRWAPPRYDAPVNVAVNDLAMMDHDFGWAVANMGNAVAKYDGYTGFWSANHTCYGYYYQLRGTSLVSDPGGAFDWDAWAVGSYFSIDGVSRYYEVFMHYQDGCAGGYAWDMYESPQAPPYPTATPNPPDPTPTPLPPPPDGSTQTYLFGIDMIPGPLGYAAGSYRDRAVTHYFDGSWWDPDFVQPECEFCSNPSRFYSVDVIEPSNVPWFGGYYTEYYSKMRYAMLNYKDATGYQWAGIPLPLNGRGFYHRPIKSIDMVSETMGWAVGDPEVDPWNSSRKLSVMYQYPFPNFTLLASPPGQAVLPGGSTTYTLTVSSPLGGFNANVALSVSGGLPPGTTVQISPDNITPETAATVSVSTSPSTPLGEYTISLTGYSHYRTGDMWFDAYRRTDLLLTVTNNPIYSINPTHAPAGTSVTLTGTGFGNSQGASDYVILAGKQMPVSAIVSWSNTQIVVQVPDSVTLFPNGPEYGYVMVRAGGSSSNTDLNFQLESKLTSITYQQVGNNVRVTLTGTSLGKDPGGFQRSTYLDHVRLGGTWIANASVISWSNNTIVFDVPNSTPSGLVSVTSNGYESNTLVYNPFNHVFLPLTQR